MGSDQSQRMWNIRVNSPNQECLAPELEGMESDNDTEKNRACADASPLGGASLQACW